MTKTVRFALIGLLMCAFSGVVPAGEPDPKEIVEKAIKASGGEANWNKYKAMTWKEKGKYYGMGDGLPYTANNAAERPDKFKMEIVGVFTQVVNGDKGWVKSGDMTKEMTKEQLAAAKENNYVGLVTQLVPLKEKGYTLKAEKPVKIDDSLANVIVVSSKGHKDVTLYIDTKSNLLVKTQATVKSMEMDGKEVKQEMFFSKYKDIEGIQTPMKVIMKQDGKLYVEAEMMEVKMHEKLDNKVFAAP